jgi:uncharacterized protein Yka (UPF0111/DUF47 family)
MAFQDLVRILVPREDHFFAYLERQADVAHRTAQALSGLRPGGDAAAVQAAVEQLELEGDQVVEELEMALQKTFVTPIDREDLQRLSSVLDDVTDFIDAAARAYVLFGVADPTPPMVAIVGHLVRCTAELAKDVPALRRHDYAAVMNASRVLRKLRKEADAIYREAVSALFRDETKCAKDLLREKAVLDELERAVERCEWVAHTLANLAVKHG